MTYDSVARVVAVSVCHAHYFSDKSGIAGNTCFGRYLSVSDDLTGRYAVCDDQDAPDHLFVYSGCFLLICKTEAVIDQFHDSFVSEGVIENY